MTLYETCEKIYEKGGQYAVIDYINENHPDQPWHFCTPCDCNQPFEGDTCLVCGTTRERSTMQVECANPQCELPALYVFYDRTGEPIPLCELCAPAFRMGDTTEAYVEVKLKTFARVYRVSGSWPVRVPWLEEENTVAITVEGGTVTDVRGLPPDYEYRIIDKDLLGDR